MKLFSNWVVGLDLTTTDEYIIQNLTQIAKKFKPTEIHLVYVASKPNFPKDVLDDIPDLHIPDMVDYKAKISNLVVEHDLSDAKVTIHILEGNPVTEILRLSDKSSADLVILGHKSKKQQGVIHKKLLRKAPCSVLFIPEIIKEEIRSIAVPTDFSDHSSMAVDLGITVAKSYDANEVHLLHVYQDATKYLSQVFETVHEINEILEKQKEIDKKLTSYAKHKLSEYIKTFDNGSTSLVPHTASIERGQDVGNAVEDWVNQYAPDLVVLGSKGENFAAATLLGSVSEHMNENDTEHLMLVIKQKGENKSLLKVLLRS
ncbi:MAG: universal stress protein [Bacteroidota bacterium]